MQALPQPLAPLSAYKQFIVVKFVPSAARPGRTEKFPIDHRTGASPPIGTGGAHWPEMWTDFETASARATAWGPTFGVGFVFTETDPFWFLDVDHALVGGQWSELAQKLCTAFAGAAIEVSQSREGLHLFGMGVCPPHKKKNVPLGIELYTEGRFVALTGLSAVGNAATRHDGALQWIVDACFKPDEAGAEHTGAGPREDWLGPTDDDELLRRALRSSSTAATFGSRASFRDLFDGNVEALSRAFPDGERAYDASSADAALAQHLAFWTGCDTARIERLMRKSALVRPKWDDRDDYLVERTIGGACSRQKEVLTDKVPATHNGPVLPAEHAADDMPLQRSSDGHAFCDAAGQVGLFKGCVYVLDRGAVLVPGGMLLTAEKFKVNFGGRVFPLDIANEKTTKDAWEAFTQSQVLRPPQADGTCFRPDLPYGTIVTDAGRTRANTWWPVQVARKAGDASPFLDLMRRLLPIDRDREILLAYMCACVQHVGKKFQWAPVIQGVEGNGKTTLSLCVAEAIGHRYVHWPKASKIAKQFNAWMVGKVFYAVEDIYTSEGQMDVIEELKPMITGGAGLEIEAKGVDQVSAEIVGNFIFNTNHLTGVRKTRNDRRFCPLTCAQQSKEDLDRDGMSGDYMERLYTWLRADGFAIVSELLHTRPIPDEFNPATRCQRAPVTSATAEAITMGMGVVEQNIIEAIDQSLVGFAGGWISSVFLDRMLERLRKASAVPPNRRRKLLEDLGFIPHPGLHEGRVNNAVMPDGAKPRLYVRKNGPLVGLTGAADIARAYTDAQSTGVTALFGG